jgi:hypothetical protein
MTMRFGTRLFYGFECRGDSLCVIGLDGSADVLLRARFPLHGADLDNPGPSAIVATLYGFLQAHEARPACGIDRHPPLLESLARRLGGPIHKLDRCELERTGLPAYDPMVRPEMAVNAHHRALLVGLSLGAHGDA